jgi:L-aspartate oxidase
MKTLIIGAGIAGATAALSLSENPENELVVLSHSESNTSYAQGGIVVRGLGDSPEALVADLLAAGAGLSSVKAATILANEGAALVQSILVETCEVNFDKSADGAMLYGLEAAHSQRRIVHVGDKTGAAISRQLFATMQSRSNIQRLSCHSAVDFIMKNDCCVGALVLDNSSGEIFPIEAGQTILATGGLGQIYLHTSNPKGAVGNGIAMAARVGATLSHLEYIQFHPTTLYTEGLMKPLLTEAVRGEGGILLNPDGERFMAKYAPDAMELAPRDVVARAIHMEMQAGDWRYMLLDLRHLSVEFLRERFPALCENAALLGLDPSQDALPIVPAAHYSCGGVEVDEWGRTSIGGLFAIGEVSCTGLHGANRLASTSLLEGLVWGHRAARYIQDAPRASQKLSIRIEQNSKPYSDLAPYWQEIKSIMWEHLGIVREASLELAVARLAEISAELEEIFQASAWDNELLSLRNAALVAYQVALAAESNPQSLGAHYRLEEVPA